MSAAGFWSSSASAGSPAALDHPDDRQLVVRDGAPTTELRLLGGFELRHDGRPLSLPVSAQRLLAFLALHERPLHRAFVAGVLWMDSSPAHASASLRTALWRLRLPDAPVVLATVTHLGIVTDVLVDVAVMAAAARRALQRQAQRCDVLTLCSSGDVLPDSYDEWVLLERERFRQLRLHALEALCDELTAAGEFGAAAEAGYAAVTSEPLRESAHRALIRTYIAEGNPAEAVRQYEIYCRVLGGELGLRPSEAMEALIRPLERGGSR